MSQTWLLIYISILHVHQDEEINLKIVANQFINNSKAWKIHFLYKTCYFQNNIGIFKFFYGFV